MTRHEDLRAKAMVEILQKSWEDAINGLADAITERELLRDQHNAALIRISELELNAGAKKKAKK